MNYLDAVEENIRENFKLQDMFSNYNDFRKYVLNKSQYTIISCLEKGSVFANDLSFFNRMGITDYTKHTNNDFQKNDENVCESGILIKPLESIVMEECYDYFQHTILNEIMHLDDSSVSKNVLSKHVSSILQLDPEKFTGYIEQQEKISDNLELMYMYGLYKRNEHESVSNNVNRMFIEIFRFITSEFEKIAEKIKEALILEEYTCRSYFLVRNIDMMTEVVFMDIEKAGRLIDVDDFERSMGSLYMNNDEVADDINMFIIKAVEFEMEKRIPLFRDKIEEAYNNSGLSLLNIL